jgi:hypothetical protein
MRVQILLATLVAFGSFVTKAQTITTKVDDFTGKSSSQTTMVILQRAMTTVVAITGFKEEKSSSIRLSITYPISPPVVIKEGEEILLKLSNGSVITLQNSQMEVLSETVRLFLPLTPTQIDELSKYRIDMIRVNTSDGAIDFKGFNESKQEQVLKLASLLK